MTPRRLPALFLLFLAGPLVGPTWAQAFQAVVPQGAGTQEQQGRFTPLDLDPRVHHIFHSSAAMSHVPGGSWTSLHLRPDRSGSLAAYTVSVSLRISSLGVPEPDDVLPREPQANRGTDATWTVRDQLVTFPAVAPTSGMTPRSTWITIPFQRPFVYVAGRPLLIEFWVEGPPTFGYLLDARVLPETPWNLTARSFGSACANASGASASFGVGAHGSPVFFPSYVDARLTPWSPGVFTIGTSTSRWGNLGLPIALDPLGAPGCEVLNDGAILVPAAGYPLPSGFVWWSGIQPPRNLNLIGARFYVQGLIMDPGINALGALTTPSWEVDVQSGPAPALGRVVTYQHSPFFGRLFLVDDRPGVVPVFAIQ